MAVEIQVLDLSAKNTSGGTIAQFAVVCYDVTTAFGAVPTGNANAGPVMGINQSRDVVPSTGALESVVENGSAMQVRQIGLSRAIVSGITVLGAPLYASATAGQVGNAPTTGNNGNGFVGFGLEAGTTAGDVVTCYLAPALQPALKQLGTFAAPLTANATPNTQTSHAHGLGYTPTYVFFVGVGAAGTGVVYISAAADATNIYEKATVASTTFIAFVA